MKPLLDFIGKCEKENLYKDNPVEFAVAASFYLSLHGITSGYLLLYRHEQEIESGAWLSDTLSHVAVVVDGIDYDMGGKNAAERWEKSWDDSDSDGRTESVFTLENSYTFDHLLFECHKYEVPFNFEILAKLLA